MKKIILKIILVISFIPDVFLLVGSIWSYFNGYTFFYSTSYGLEGAYTFLLVLGAYLTYTFILPICLIYQLALLVSYIIKKSEKGNKNNNIKGEDNNGNK